MTWSNTLWISCVNVCTLLPWLILVSWKELFVIWRVLSRWDFILERTLLWIYKLTIDSNWDGFKETSHSTNVLCTVLAKIWSHGQLSVNRRSPRLQLRLSIENLHHAAQELNLLLALLRALDILQYRSTLLHFDNLSHRQSRFTQPIKALRTDFHYIREQVDLGLIETWPIPATEQLDDIFTKYLSRWPFVRLRAKLGISEPTRSLRGGGGL